MPYDISDDVMTSLLSTPYISITKRDKGLVSIKDVLEMIHAESNGHVTDDVT